jgi:hypothetical protein
VASCCSATLLRRVGSAIWSPPPSIPRPSGEPIKTDRRDALKLARSNDQVGVRVPGPADEAVRDLVRAHDDSVREQRNARHRLKALLLPTASALPARPAWRCACGQPLRVVRRRMATVQPDGAGQTKPSRVIRDKRPDKPDAKQAHTMH